MRNAFAKEITALAAQDERIVLLAGDIGNRLFDDFKSRFPTRFYNCGIAEANMTGVAAGLALSGLRPVTYTITPFNTTRCLEQIRVDACYHKLPIIITGVGGGMAYASLGGTHHACEDIALLRALPHMTVVCPGDAVEVRLALRAALQEEGPVYLRLGKKGEPVVHQKEPDFVIGRAIVAHTGTEVCLLSTGNIFPVVMETAEELSNKGVSAQVVSFHTVKPLDEDFLTDVFMRFPLVVTVEEHSVVGGLGGGIAEWLTDQGPLKGRLLKIGTPDTFLHEAGEQEYAREVFGLTPSSIAEKTLQAYSAAASTRLAP